MLQGQLAVSRDDGQCVITIPKFGEEPLCSLAEVVFHVNPFL